MTGLRASEAVESVRLLNHVRIDEFHYYNPERQCLEHFRFPEIFLRKTKKAYISFMSLEMLEDCKSFAGKHFVPSYNQIRVACYQKGITCDMRYCRKLHGSWLNQSGISGEVVDFLQGRVSPSVFSRHYLTPTEGLRDKVLDTLNKLKEKLEK